MKRGCMIIAILLANVMPGGGGIDASARKVATTIKAPGKGETKRKRVKRKDIETIVPSAADSLEWARKIVFAGYDKQASSSEESFFISNKGERQIKELRLRITYLDMEGRMLHQRDEELKIEIPAGETRKADIKSFDKQHSFYHIESNKPRNRATPFRTKIEILRIKLAIGRGEAEKNAENEQERE